MLQNKDNNYNKLSIKVIVNIGIALAFVLLFYTAEVFNVKYHMGISRDSFTLSQINDSMITILFVINIISMLCLVLLSIKTNLYNRKKQTLYAVISSVISSIIILIKGYAYIEGRYIRNASISINPTIFFFIILIIILIVNNTDLKSKINR